MAAAAEQNRCKGSALFSALNDDPMVLVRNMTFVLMYRDVQDRLRMRRLNFLSAGVMSRVFAYALIKSVSLN